ncbi:carbohydrate esterase family 15 protein [Diaporthe eres]|nr:carbohydrate esterase family 15 protein [Diaporthe eres]
MAIGCTGKGVLAWSRAFSGLIQGRHNFGTHLENVSSLPNPFTFQDGAAVSTAADWFKRADELKRLFQTYELGWKPGKPAVFDAQLNGTTLSITTGLTQTTAITWNVSISYPTNSTGLGPYAAMIAYDGLSIPLDADIASITLTIDNIAQQNDQSSRGVGNPRSFHCCSTV